jgi:N-acyl-D-amino-acid deacylase
MRRPHKDWENLCHLTGDPEKILLLAFASANLKMLEKKTLAGVAASRGKSPDETVIDLLVEDGSTGGQTSMPVAAFFMMSEANVRLGLSQSWVTLGSDSSAHGSHPRTAGTFARFLGHYVRDQHVTTLSDAIRRLSALPAENFKLKDRGKLLPGYFADIVVFDPAKVTDHATFDRPAEPATGVIHVLVNGSQVLVDGKETGLKPGHVVRGPGYRR